VRVRAADDLGVQRARHDEVVDEPGLAGEQRRILPPNLAAAHHGAHDTPALLVSAAAKTAFTMLW
jgi:hypothetical protein